MIELLIRLQAWSEQVQWYKIFKRIGLITLAILIVLVIYLEMSDERSGEQVYSSNNGYSTNYDSIQAYKAEVTQMSDSKQKEDFLTMVDMAISEDLEVDDAEFSAIYEAHKKITADQAEAAK